jgi:beta-lactamase class A
MTGRILKFCTALLLAAPTPLAMAPVQGRQSELYQTARDTVLQQQVESIARATRGRVGVAAMDLDSGGIVLLNGDQPFPMASTAKIAIAATYLSMVEQGKLRLDQEWPMLVPVRESVAARGPVARVHPGTVLSAQALMELSITRSNNEATDALLSAVGGPSSVNAWLARAGIAGQHLDHTMATLVRDDGRIDPATVIDQRTASTPRAMVSLLGAIDRGGALSPQSRAVLLDTMTRTVTGSKRIKAGLPEGVLFAHKTGTLRNVTDDVGIIRLPDGRHLALAIFVAGPDGHSVHGEVISSIARTLYFGYSGQTSEPQQNGAYATALQRR